MAAVELGLVGLGLIALALAALMLRARPAGARTRAWTPKIRDDRALATTLQRIARKHRQPAMAAALVRGGEIVARATIGSTMEGGTRAVDLESRFHIGSTTKGVTALLIAILAREGRLRYDSTLASVLARPLDGRRLPAGHGA